MINLQRFKLGRFDDLPPMDGSFWKTRLYDGQQRLCDVARISSDGLTISDVRIPHDEFMGLLEAIKLRLEDETGLEPDYALELIIASATPGANLGEALTQHYKFSQKELQAETEEDEEGDFDESTCCV
jgi:hypothetical protein